MYSHRGNLCGGCSKHWKCNCHTSQPYLLDTCQQDPDQQTRDVCISRFVSSPRCPPAEEQCVPYPQGGFTHPHRRTRSCHLQEKAHNWRSAWERLRKRHPRLLLFLGPILYMDTSNYACMQDLNSGERLGCMPTCTRVSWGSLLFHPVWWGEGPAPGSSSRVQHGHWQVYPAILTPKQLHPG